MRAILDAGPLIAAWDERDDHHAWAVRLFQTFRGPFHTSELVLSEVAHLTGRDSSVMEGVRTGRLVIEATLVKDGEAMQRVLDSYSAADLADASVIAISEKLPRLKILTTDERHFAAYRRKDKSAPDLELP